MPTRDGTAGNSDIRPRYLLWGGIAVVVALVVGGTVAVRASPWGGCYFGTSGGGNGGLEFVSSAESTRADLGDMIEQIESVPGVGSFSRAATLDQEVRLAAGAHGDVIVSDSPYFSKANEFRDTSFDPTSGEVSWSRGQAGQVSPPELAGDSVLSFAAVEGGIYRMSVLDAADGGVRGCVDVDRIDRAGIGRATYGVSADSSTVVVATPAAKGSIASAFSVAGRDALWTATLPGADGTISWIGGTVVVDRFEARDVFTVGPIAWGNEVERDRASITGLDGASGEERWVWPTELTDDSPHLSGSTVPFFDGPSDVVVVAAVVSDGDDSTSQLIGLDAVSGAERWSKETESSAWVHGFGTTFLTLARDVLSSFDAATGDELWSVPVTGGASGPRPDYAQPWGDDVIVSTADGITIVDLATGELSETAVDSASFVRLTVVDDALALVVDDTASRDLLVFDRVP